jgi:hypothetical protein
MTHHQEAAGPEFVRRHWAYKSVFGNCEIVIETAPVRDRPPILSITEHMVFVLI